MWHDINQHGVLFAQARPHNAETSFLVIISCVNTVDGVCSGYVHLLSNSSYLSYLLLIVHVMLLSHAMAIKKKTIL